MSKTLNCNCAINGMELMEISYDVDEKKIRVYEVGCDIDVDSDFRDCWSESCGHYTESGPEYEVVDYKHPRYELIKEEEIDLSGVANEEGFMVWANDHKYHGCDQWCAGSFEDYEELLIDYFEGEGYSSDGCGRLIRSLSDCYYDSGYWRNSEDEIVF